MDSQKIRIHQLIVHKIYHKTFDQPTLYDLESPLDEALASMLRKQIADNLDHKYTSPATFEPRADFESILEDLSESCRLLLHAYANSLS